MDTSDARPRVSAAMLPGLVGKKVLLVGKVRRDTHSRSLARFFSRAPPKPLECSRLFLSDPARALRSHLSP